MNPCIYFISGWALGGLVNGARLTKLCTLCSRTKRSHLPNGVGHCPPVIPRLIESRNAKSECACARANTGLGTTMAAPSFLPPAHKVYHPRSARLRSLPIVTPSLVQAGKKREQIGQNPPGICETGMRQGVRVRSCGSSFTKGGQTSGDETSAAEHQV